MIMNKQTRKIHKKVEHQKRNRMSATTFLIEIGYGNWVAFQNESKHLFKQL